MNWLTYSFNKYHIIERINIDYQFYNKTGKYVFNQPCNMVPTRTTISTYVYGACYVLSDKKEYKKTFNKQAKKLLNMYNKKKIITIGNGAIVSGPHINKCVWHLDFTTKILSYKEYKALIDFEVI